MSASYKEWALQLVNRRTGEPIDDDSGKFYVLTAGSATFASIYRNEYGTAITQPCTFTDGRYRFFTDRSVTSLDISGVTEGGLAFFLDGITQSNQKIDIDPDKIEQTLIVPWYFNDNETRDTGLDLPANCLIHEALLKVTTVDATETIDFGFDNATEGGDLDGLIAAASIATAGYVELKPQITNGSNIDYVGTNYVGALLCTSIAGSDSVTAVGGWTAKKYLTDGTIKSLVYTCSAGSDTGRGFFILKYDKLPT